jgi:hypothetical protein
VTHSHLLTTLAVLSTCIAAQASLANPVTPGAETRIERYREALTRDLPPQAQRALARIEDASRQWLALRAYIRAGERLVERWSWTDDQIEAFERTPHHDAFLAEVRRVQSRFEAENPGYTLYANTEVRSLDTQLERWNENASVGRVSDAVHRAVRRELIESDYPKIPTEAHVDRLATFLRRWNPRSAPALAAPGLSAHGQLRAIDFAVYKEGKIIAPTTLTAADAAWKRDGWAAKLKQATLGTRFIGPLESPDEPWHYEYSAPTRIAGEPQEAKKQ